MFNQKMRPLDRTVIKSALGAAAMALLGTSQIAEAAILHYTFVTDVQGTLNNGADGAFDGLNVTGSFDYDNGSGPMGFIPFPPLAGSNVYPGRLTNLSAQLGSNSFTDPVGAVVVSNDNFRLFDPAGVDALLLAFDNPAAPSGLVGFITLGHQLVGVGFSIVETSGAADFLNNQDLPASLPSGFGLLLDFQPLTGGATVSTLFPNARLTLVPEREKVPEPAALGLLGMGVLGIAQLRRRKARAI